MIDGVLDEPLTSSKGMMGIVRLPVIWVIIFAIISCALTDAFVDSTLIGHLASV
jgi:hypothetical protein